MIFTGNNTKDRLLGKLKWAIKALTLALMVNMAVLGFASAATSDSFSSVYKNYQTAMASQDVKSAIALAKQALSLGKIKFGETHQNTINLHYNYAFALLDNGQGDDALQALVALEDVVEQKHGRVSNDYLSVLITQLDTIVAQPYLKSGGAKYKRYEKILDNAIAVAEQLGQHDNSVKAMTFYALADSINTGRIAENYFRKVYKLNQTLVNLLAETVGDNDARTVKTRFILGKMHTGRGKVDKAIASYENVVSSINSNLAKSHPLALASHAALVKLFEETNQSEKATEHCIAIAKLDPWDENTDPIPLYRLSPKYPRAMVTQQKEGLVILSFDIDEQGFVNNVAVLQKSHHAFANNAQDALAQWRYAPRIEKGRPVATSGLKVQLDFTLAR